MPDFTGLGEPLSQLIHRAEELEVPILKVELDTLASVEIIEQAFGHVRIHESIKASYAVQLLENATKEFSKKLIFLQFFR